MPVGGGIYDQDPSLIDEWHIILAARPAGEARRQVTEKKKAGMEAKRPRI